MQEDELAAKLPVNAKRPHLTAKNNVGVCCGFLNGIQDYKLGLDDYTIQISLAIEIKRSI